ncbi:MAG: lipase [Pseudonocardiales bacterium]|nr:MAG: lipase [Pseudonocardiales bacterium]
MLTSLAPARRRLVLVLATLASGALVLTLVLTITAALRPDKQAKPVSQAKPGPVILVPGYGGSTGGLDALAVVLRAHGKDAQVLQLPGDGRGDLDAQASVLGAAATAALARTHAASVDVIGYSAGGVVARLWVRDHGGDGQARRVITLGSPHHGTEIAAFAGSVLPGACPTACQQLAVDSPLLTALNAGDETPSGPTFVSIWTTQDDVVLPPDSASLSGASNITVQSVCASDRVRHSGLPRDNNVAAMVLSELAAGPPVALGARDCGRFSS